MAPPADHCDLVRELYAGLAEARGLHADRQRRGMPSTATRAVLSLWETMIDSLPAAPCPMCPLTTQSLQRDSQPLQVFSKRTVARDGARGEVIQFPLDPI